MNEPYKFASMGVRGRLLLAFLGISMFSLVAAASGLYSLTQVGSALNKITEQRVPEALSWLELSRRVESVVHAAPALLAVNTDSARIEISKEITSQISQLEPFLHQSRSYETEDEKTAMANVLNLFADMAQNLLSLDELVKKRLTIVAFKGKRIRDLSRANSIAKRMLAPGERILDAQMADLNRIQEAAESNKLSTEKSDLVNSIISLIPQQRAVLLVDSIHNNLLKITDADTTERIDVLIFPLKKYLKELYEVSLVVSKQAKRRLARKVALLEDLTFGQKSLSEIRKNELTVIAQAEALLAVNVKLSNFLTNRVDFLVNSASSDIEKSNIQAVAIQVLNRNILIGIAALSLLSSFLIVWLYVGRNLIARLTALSDSMLAIAGGNLKAPLPDSGSSDEIGRMAESLVVFRDTAIEVKENNLRNIETARRRLVDAIENSSEGFAFFDPDDRLVLCNTRYKEILFPNTDIDIEPGTAFETIIRRSAENGNIVDAEGRIDEWFADRMAFHHDPGEPRIQQRSGGQWILITERKTGDGGIVAIYSDITDLKRREEELTTKSNALEETNERLKKAQVQISKYIDPHVTEKIFKGEFTAELSHQRKKLTMFFSDIKDFTQFTDAADPEDVAKLLNEYLGEMAQIVRTWGGTIPQFTGDSIYAIFGAPDSKGEREDALACLRMALEMQKKMKSIREKWWNQGVQFPFEIRCGIHTGMANVGNYGSEGFMEYSAIGLNTNLASRLEQACQPGEIYLSHASWALVNDEILCEEVGTIEVKGFHYPIQTYRVLQPEVEIAPES
ncbi:adenylate/guanylate cyclase domain-containing protein [Desulfobacula sp.]|uniref:adenylate/guanylate cyclase domain-containing protein n=1 Tax=Desulfobacula sp. TaxID=2593537 RepID=UPI0025BA246B|nr:adenylate/guanylate cyclase domain-containing protein [Desulfobacula sp.]MBC2704089.1 PAS-domain containing protein [Desulfobacula sp.]